MTKVIKFFAGPGTGKSTTVAQVFSMLKQRGENAELVQEYVKTRAWEGLPAPSGLDQFHIFATQMRNESLLYGKVDWVITDSPVEQAEAYLHYCPLVVANVSVDIVQAYREYTRQIGVEEINVFLRRSKAYSSKGRWQTEEEAKNLDAVIKGVLKKNKMKYVELDTDTASVEAFVKGILGETISD